MAEQDAKPGFAALVRVFGRIGLINFGGPAGQIALMHRVVVEERRWIGEADYLHALNFCNLLPGPEAQQLATYIGWRLHGMKGGLAAGSLFVLPGALVMLGLSILYAYAAELRWFSALFLGIKAAVLAIVVEALVRIGKRALDTSFKRGLAFAALIALALFNLPFPALVLGGMALGMVAGAWRPYWLVPAGLADAEGTQARPSWRATLQTALIWLFVWSAPMALILVALGREHELWRIGIFFSQLAVVTFGGAYAVLAYMAQEAVQSFGWLQAGEMADGLGLAESTPGPLIMVTQFVGFLAAFREPAPFSPLAAGIIGAVLTTWVTFAPCFLWIFSLAPWIERLRQATRLRSGLAAVTAIVVGVIANLALWFAAHLLFGEVGKVETGMLHYSLPVWSSFDARAGLLALVAFALLFGLRLGVLPVLGLCAMAGLAAGTV